MNPVKSLYIHFPFCSHLCDYCDFYKYKLEGQAQIENFEKSLRHNLSLHDELLQTNGFKMAPLETLYLGGGTPSLWGAAGVEFINKEIIANWSLSENCEFTLEVDPDNWSRDELLAWRTIGVNRISVGTQSFSSDFIKILDRQHTLDEIRELLSFLKAEHFNFSVDLLLGAPRPEGLERNLIQEIDELEKFGPAHFSVYILKTRSNYALTQQLPNEDSVADEYSNVCAHLQSLGYDQYEVSNFAKPRKESRHNLKYWKCESVAALGAVASGLLVSANSALRYQFKKSGNSFSEERLGDSELHLERVYLGLRSRLGYDFLEASEQNFEAVSTKWKSLGYVAQHKDRLIVLNSKGFLMLDSLMGDLFSLSIL